MTTKKTLAVKTVPAKSRRKKPGWTEARRTKFLQSLAETANVTRSAKAAGMTPSAAYKERRRRPAFAQAWAEAMEQALDTLEAVMLERALHGVEKTVYYAGKNCGSVRQYSDALAMFLLRARRPQTYGTTDSPVDDADLGEGEDARAVIAQRLADLGQSQTGNETP